MIKKFTIEELRQLSIKQLRNIDVDSPEYETLVNQVVNEKLVVAPIEYKINRKDIPDIRTPEEEAVYQKVINERESEFRPKEEILEVTDESSVVLEDKEPEIIKPTVVVVDAPKRFCDSCDSKGRFHKSGCPNKI